MARMLLPRESVEKHYNYSTRHIRQSRRVPGAAVFADAMEPAVANMQEKNRIYQEKAMMRDTAYDAISLCDFEQDIVIRSVYNKSKDFDSRNPGQRITEEFFPDGKFGKLVRMNPSEETVAVETLAKRLETLPAEHPLFPLAAELREKAAAVQQAIQQHATAVKELKFAKANVETAQLNVIKQYETNYLEARKALGREYAEKLFPRHKPSAAVKEESETN